MILLLSLSSNAILHAVFFLHLLKVKYELEIKSLPRTAAIPVNFAHARKRVCVNKRHISCLVRCQVMTLAGVDVL